MADQKLGIWLIGACGNVAATATLGLLSLKRQLAPPIGLVTELPEFSRVPLAGWDTIEISGHDIRRPALLDSVQRMAAEGVVPPAMVEACQEGLLEVESRIAPGTAYGAGGAIRELTEFSQADEASTAPREIISQLQADFREFLTDQNLRSLVVLNVASTEPLYQRDVPKTWPKFEPLLDSAGTPLPASTLYAIAALEMGLPFVNFTPSTGASLPAVEDLAKRKKICHAGQDGKTGETLLKTVLAPMFASRNLQVESWVGHNIFGNLDGRILDNPANRATKVATKDRVLGGTLGYDPQTLVSIEYIQSLGDWKTAWDHIHFRGFLGTLMTLQFTWQGSDSALAAPLVLDLARLVDLAQRRGIEGAVEPLACFFKSPLGTNQHDFAKQHAALLQWVSDLSKGAA